MTSMSGPRRPSETSIVRRAPSRPSTFPPGRPSSARPTSSAAKTNVIRVADPDVISTNHGRASQVIWLPVVETISATRSARMARSRRMLVLLIRSRAPDVDVAAHRLRPQLELGRALRRRLVADLEVGGRVAAPRANVEPNLRAAPDADPDVAGRRLQRELAPG